MVGERTYRDRPVFWGPCAGGLTRIMGGMLEDAPARVLAAGDCRQAGIPGGTKTRRRDGCPQTGACANVYEKDQAGAPTGSCSGASSATAVGVSSAAAAGAGRGAATGR